MLKKILFILLLFIKFSSDKCLANTKELVTCLDDVNSEYYKGHQREFLSYVFRTLAADLLEHKQNISFYKNLAKGTLGTIMITTLTAILLDKLGCHAEGTAYITFTTSIFSILYFLIHYINKDDKTENQKKVNLMLLENILKYYDKDLSKKENNFKLFIPKGYHKLFDLLKEGYDKYGFAYIETQGLTIIKDINTYY